MYSLVSSDALKPGDHHQSGEKKERDGERRMDVHIRASLSVNSFSHLFLIITGSELRQSLTFHFKYLVIENVRFCCNISLTNKISEENLTNLINFEFLKIISI